MEINNTIFEDQKNFGKGRFIKMAVERCLIFVQILVLY